MKNFRVLVPLALAVLSIAALRTNPTAKLAPLQRVILLDFRLPRVLLALMVGSGMALSGWAAQNATRNPLASPDILSVPAAASLGVMLTLWLAGGRLLPAIALPLAAAVSGILSALLVFGLAGRRRKLDGSGLLLTGIAVGSLLTAGYLFVALNSPPATFQYGMAFLTGSLSRASWDYVRLLLPAWWVLTLAIGASASQIQVLLFEDGVAAALGVRPDARRRAMLCLSAALGAVCVGVGGNMAFVGFAAPHFVRRATHRTLTPPWVVCATGALLLLASDLIGQLIIRPGEIPAGIVTAVAGAPLFVVLLLRRKAIR
jgi:iron complex transport system permease protein